MIKDPRVEQAIPSSTVEKLLLNAEKRDKAVEISKEEVKEFKKVVNSLLSSKNGRFFWKMSKKFMRIDVIDQDFNPINMAVSKAYRNYYNFILQMLNEDVRMELGREGK